MCGFFVLHAANNQFSDNFDNGGGLLSGVLLFQMIFSFKRLLEATYDKPRSCQE